MKTSKVWQRITKEEVYSSLMSVSPTPADSPSLHKDSEQKFSKHFIYSCINYKVLPEIKWKCPSKAIKTKRLHCSDIHLELRHSLKY